MNIKDRLRQLEKLPRKQESKPAAPSRNLNADARLGGVEISNDFGSYSLIEKKYPVDAKHGIANLFDFIELTPDLLASLDNNASLAEISLRKTLFIDTETTGLSGGVGVFAFLIGVGFYDNDQFILRQYFMNDFDEEAAILNDLKVLAKKYSLVVSYNGKSYDLPLLNSRNIYQGIRAPFDHLLHFDLLHTVRRLWQHRLSECSLATAEKEILQVSRHGDIPGHLIPSRYFNYLKTRDATEMQPVLYHNQQDILSMLCLLALAMQTVRAPSQYCQSAKDRLSVGKTFERCGKPEQAIRLYREAISGNINSDEKNDVLHRTAQIHKKMQAWQEAAKTWERATTTRFHPLPYVELAKHHEHRTKDISKAKSLVDKALSELETVIALRRNHDWEFFRADLQYRRKRLMRKLAAQPQV